MIKRYGDFIKENISKEISILDFDKNYSIFMDPNATEEDINEYELYFEKIREDFTTEVRNIKEDYPSWFSTLASQKEGTPDQDFEEIQDKFNSNHYTLDTIKNLFSDEVSIRLNENYSDWITKCGLDDICGYVDVYLYMLNEKLKFNTKVWLGGDTNKDILVDSDELEKEYIIKYAYGYHKTRYGKLFLKQAEILPSVFVSRAFSYFREYLNTNVGYDIVYMTEREFGKKWDEFTLNNYLTMDDDRFILHYSEMSDDYEKTLDIAEDKPVYCELFKNCILSSLRDLEGMNIQDTDYDLIFSDIFW